MKEKKIDNVKYRRDREERGGYRHNYVEHGSVPTQLAPRERFLTLRGHTEGARPSSYFFMPPDATVH